MCYNLWYAPPQRSRKNRIISCKVEMKGRLFPWNSKSWSVFLAMLIALHSTPVSRWVSWSRFTSLVIVYFLFYLLFMLTFGFVCCYCVFLLYLLLLFIFGFICCYCLFLVLSALSLLSFQKTSISSFLLGLEIRRSCCAQRVALSRIGHYGSNLEEFFYK